MKNLLQIATVLFMITILTVSCSANRRTVNRGTVNSSTAPGQVKKVTGAKSAKAYAPGQQKKNGNKN
ncbi:MULTISPECIES: hypothetical protein [unclassified Allomuricauda]|uniref:hypothetical protein n=1 Tax=unclassified Allomuricauda TaxID=2615049 RepID=UPI00273FAAE0|nr:MULTISPECIES: hypothetical protein [unclassified Allomuricauda]